MRRQLVADREGDQLGWPAWERIHNCIVTWRWGCGIGRRLWRGLDVWVNLRLRNPGFDRPKLPYALQLSVSDTKLKFSI